MGIKDGICPKCGSDLIYSNTQQNKRDLSGNAILIKVSWSVTWAYLRHYVCAMCGYIESYIADDKSINHIIENWQPLNKEKRKNDNS